MDRKVAVEAIEALQAEIRRYTELRQQHEGFAHAHRQRDAALDVRNATLQALVAIGAWLKVGAVDKAEAVFNRVMVLLHEPGDTKLKPEWWGHNMAGDLELLISPEATRLRALALNELASITTEARIAAGNTEPATQARAITP